MPDTRNIEGQPGEVNGSITPQDTQNGRQLAEIVSALLVFLYIYGWFDITGKRISTVLIRAGMDKLLAVSGSRIERITAQMLRGEISLPIWQARMRNILKAGYSVQTSVVKGGIKAMTPEDWTVLSRLANRQMQFLNRFARQLSEGLETSDAQIIARAKSYANSIRSIGEQMALESAKQRRVYARRVLTTAEHCEGCIAEAGKGWQPAELVAPIGSQECMTHCRCYIETAETAPTDTAAQQRIMSDRWNQVVDITVRL